MLGTNDAHKSDLAWFNDYKRRIAGVFDRFGAAVNSAGRTPLVIVSAILPVLYEEEGSIRHIANTRINDWYNPWLAQQAQDRGFIFGDVNTAIRQLDNWQELYSDGIHLWGLYGQDYGYTWLAAEFLDVVAGAVETPGDFDDDGDVDLDDFVILKQNFGTGATAVAQP